MNTVLIISTILAISHAASVVPIDSSSVNVKQSGQDYSYTIQENHGVAIDPSHVIHQQIPLVKAAHLPAVAPGSILLNQIDQAGIQSNQEQLQGQAQEHVQTRLQGQIQGQNVRQQEQLKSINYVAPSPIGAYHVIPSNIQYGFSYPYGLHYPINLIRIV